MVVNLGVAAFWLAIGGWFVAMALTPWLRQREYQRTIRAMIEKDGKIDAETLDKITGKGPDVMAQQDPQATEDFGRRMFGAGIFFAGLLLGMFAMFFFFTPHPGNETPGMTEFLWGAGSFIVSCGGGGVIAYHVAKKPKRPPATGEAGD